MKTRVITAILIIAVVAFPVIYGSWALEALAVFIVVTGCYEWLHILKNYDRWKFLVLPLTILAVLASRFVPVPYIYPFFAIMVMIYWGLPVFMESFTVPCSQAALFCFVLYCLAYHSINDLIPVHTYLWTICFATYGSDTFAYFGGRAFGKHKMNPRISPKKTWEGCFCGIIGGFVLSFGLSFLYGQGLNPALNLALCIICPITAELGDLCFSSIKRYYGVKDFSNLLPGHGGILDRIDSLLANIIIFGVLYTII